MRAFGAANNSSLFLAIAAALTIGCSGSDDGGGAGNGDGGSGGSAGAEGAAGSGGTAGMDGSGGSGGGPGGAGGAAGSGGVGAGGMGGGVGGTGGSAGDGGTAGMGGTGNTGGRGGSGGTDGLATFSDETFLDSEWTLIVRTTGLGGSSSASQVASGGSPDSYRSVVTRHNGAQANRWTCVYALSIKDSALYDPSSGGAIGSIDYSEDAKAIQRGQETGPALCQSGECYISVAGTTTALSDWGTLQRGRLLSEDFTLIDTSLGNQGLDDTRHPDFSSSGAAVEFGFYRGICATPYPFGRDPVQSEAGVDNWTITVNSE